jgi:hypothetical protein
VFIGGRLDLRRHLLRRSSKRKKHAPSSKQRYTSNLVSKIAHGTVPPMSARFGSKLNITQFTASDLKAS